MSSWLWLGLGAIASAGERFAPPPLFLPPPPQQSRPFEAAPPAEASRSETGLAWLELKPGQGPKPGPDAKVTVHYTGWTTDGQQFDSSFDRGIAATFPLTRVIPGWTEGLQRMSPGAEFRLWIPEDLAYRGRTGKPQGTLIFDVLLISFSEPRPVPADVAAPPADAMRSPTGLAWRVLEAGPGTGPRPEPTSTVQVHYAGWTTDGRQFDSSWDRGTPMRFGLDQVIAGWTEGLQQMSVGDTYRLWIPGHLAYDGHPGRPQGMLVFDIELLEVGP